jgi:two-component system, cell cycle response regulator
MGAKQPIRVLVVQDAKSDFRHFMDDGLFEIDPVRPEQLQTAIRNSAKDKPQIVLLGAGKSSQHLSAMLKRIQAAAANVPVLIVPNVAEDDEATDGAAKAKKVPDSRLDGKKLARLVRRTMHKHRLRPELAHLALTDDLTGLYNQQGFLLLGSERMKMANGIKKNLLVFFADLGNLKEINERFGVQEGDRALVKTGEIFRKTFRNSDLTSRFGGDEFTALVIEDADQSADSIIQRLEENMTHLEATENDYHLSLNVGMTRYVPETRASLKKLLAQAAQSQNEQLVARRAEVNAKVVLTFPISSNSSAGKTPDGHGTSWQTDSRKVRKSSGRDT